MRTALLLAGCGARMIIQAGMIKAFVQMGLQYDGLYGTSAGALNGAMLHAGDLAGLLDLVMAVRNKNVYNLAAPWNPWTRNASLYDTAPLAKLIDKYVEPAKIRANPKPFVLNATNLSGGQGLRYMAAGMTDIELKRRLLQSASIPGLFPLQWVGDVAFADGGLTNDYCVEEAWLDGYERIIVLTAMVAETARIRNVVDAVGQLISVGIESQLAREVAAATRGGAQVIVVKPDRPTNIGIIDFDYKQDRKALVQWGYNLAEAALDPLTKKRS